MRSLEWCPSSDEVRGFGKRLVGKTCNFAFAKSIRSSDRGKTRDAGGPKHRQGFLSEAPQDSRVVLLLRVVVVVLFLNTTRARHNQIEILYIVNCALVVVHAFEQSKQKQLRRRPRANARETGTRCIAAVEGR